MTTRASLACVIVGALTIAGTQRGDAVAAANRPAVAADASTGSPVLRIAGDDRLSPRQIDELRRGSVTARDLLARIASLPSTILIMHAEPLFFSQTRLYGRTRFWINAGQLFGYIQYQGRSLHNFATQCLIVHELGHVLEVANVDRRDGMQTLQTLLLSHAVGIDPSIAKGVETEFPQQLALAVLQELRTKGSGQSVLAELAAAHHIVIPVAGVASAWTPESGRDR